MEKDDRTNGVVARWGRRKLNRQEFLRMAGAGAGIAALSGPLAACSSFVGGAGQGSEDGGGGSLRMASNTTAQEALLAIIKTFEKENPGTKVNLTLADTDKLQTTLRTQLASGTAPDVFFVWPGNGNAMALEQVGPAGYAIGLLIYEEAALIDGASQFQAFRKIVFPLLRPVTGTVIILNAIFVWNDFLTPLLYVGGTPLQTLPVAIFSFVGQYVSQWGLVFAGLVIGVTPILITYFLLQRYIIKGFASGLKG